MRKYWSLFHITLIVFTIWGLQNINKDNNLDELASYSENEYIKNAIKLARDVIKLAELRESLRSRMCDSELINGKLFTQKLEARYLAVTKKHICG